MIQLRRDGLLFSFPEVHKAAALRIEFQRTLRIPDDATDCPLPPGLGTFPLRHVDDYANDVPGLWLEHGGVMLPMYQSEAMWLNFRPRHAPVFETDYPFAIKVAAGKINAVTGHPWSDGLTARPQDYMVAPAQPWLDGYCVEKGVIRQFVAMPLGAGYTAEEQLSSEAEHGGLQIVVYPMKREVFQRRFPKVDLAARERMPLPCAKRAGPDMGLAPGGRMRQEIYEDHFGIEDWDREQSSRCFVHIANSLVWGAITGELPPTVPPTAMEYTEAGLPWFEYYDEAAALAGAESLSELKSISTLAVEKGDVPLPENQAVTPETVVKLRRGLARNQVREGAF